MYSIYKKVFCYLTFKFTCESSAWVAFTEEDLTLLTGSPSTSLPITSIMNSFENRDYKYFSQNRNNDAINGSYDHTSIESCDSIRYLFWTDLLIFKYS